MKPNLPSKSNSAAMGHSSYGDPSGSVPEGSPLGPRGSKPPSEGENSPSNTSLKSRSGPSSQQGSPRTRVPLKTILQNFLNHVESLESEEPTGDPMGQTTYELEFQRLKAFSDSLKQQAEFSCSEGEMEVNRKKNRYKDILPFDESRVLLSEYPGVPGSDYINANYIKGASGSNAYIACQGRR